MGNYPIRRHNVTGAYNLRDLGGYMTIGGAMTDYGVFFRSDLLTHYNQNEKYIIDRLNLKLIIDLRFAMEKHQDISKFGEIEGAKVVHIPLFPEFSEKDREITKEDIAQLDLADIYISTAKHQGAKFAEVFNALAEIKEGGVLFHCSAGKDRTGMVSALLLDLVGVKRCDIVSDYQISYTLIKEKFEVELDDINMINMLASKPEHINKFMDYIKTNFGSSEKYLLDAGLSKNNIEIIKSKFLKRF